MRGRIAYQPGSSVLHRLHPLVKLLWLLVGTVAVFGVGSPWPVLAAVCLLLAAFPLARLRLAGLRGTRLLASTALLLGFLQVLFVREGGVLLQVGPLTVWRGGAEAGAYVAGRFISVVLLSYLFVLTTEPNDLAYALMRAGLPYRYGFALITALRLVPVFEQEGQIVYNAQLARGVQYDVRSPRRFVVLARQFFLPLLVSALGKVDSLAVSMEGRCFGQHPTRTFLREVRAGWVDALALGVLMALVVGLLVARWA
ncbi:MAG: energy-coupling factor transporter transmembrane component T [Anaerolineae bacterium]|nr:energy-coupling factor transporter transmembrane component T [Anaerolineae bacterium]MDX9830369.1 energy-coupling factor transporter transmembrane component T [Anaerolineae bacterium]